MVVAQDASANAGRGIAAPTPAANTTIATHAARPDFVQILNEPMSPPPGFEVQEFSAIPISAKYQCRQRCVQTAARVSYCSAAPALLERTVMPHIPVHPSAQKRHRQNLKRAERNRVARTRARTSAKTAAETIASSTDEAAAREALKQATKVLYKAISNGTMHRNTVRRKVARLSQSLHRKFGKKA